MKAPSRFLQAVVGLAVKAGQRILSLYRPALPVVELPNHQWLTAASLASHHFLTESLQALQGGFPVLSALSPATRFEDRQEWETYWLLDPLEGTLDFAQQRDYFTVNIALVHQNRAVLGVVYAPALQTCYFAAEGCGAFKQVGAETPEPLQARLFSPVLPAVAGSPSQLNPALEVFLNRLGKHHFLPSGHAWPFCQVAEGGADIYPRLGLSWEWDTAAPQCIVEAAGGFVHDMQGRPLLYNAKPSLLNPYFLAFGDNTRDWAGSAKGIAGSPRPAPPPPNPLLKKVVALALEAGRRILAIYVRDFRVGNKADGGLLTAADLVAHHFLTEQLESLDGRFPVISAESAMPPFEERREWETYWLVDPLNGVEAFIQRNNEFTVNIALIRRNRPVLGVVYAPALQTCYFSAEGCGAFKWDGKARPAEIHVKAAATPRLAVLGTGGADNTLLRHRLARLGEHEFQKAGGSALGCCQIAEGRADLLLSPEPGEEWGMAAAHFIVEAAGGGLMDWRGEPLRYNIDPSMRHHGYLAVADGSKDWLSNLSEGVADRQDKAA